MKLMVNGQERELGSVTTVADCLRALRLENRYIAVAHNGDVLDRATFADVSVAEGDRLEIVRPVGGG